MESKDWLLCSKYDFQEKKFLAGGGGNIPYVICPCLGVELIGWGDL